MTCVKARSGEYLRGKYGRIILALVTDEQDNMNTLAQDNDLVAVIKA